MVDTNTPKPDSRPRPWLFVFLGLKRRQGKWLKVRLTIWGWILCFAIAGAVGSAAFAEYSMQPQFCKSCHIMEPYYQAWHQSTHKNVPCVKCHFKPGLENTLWGKFQASSQAVKYITHTYGSKPHAEIYDASCMRQGCHEKRLLEGKVNWPIKSSVDGHTITIRFDHTPHLTKERRGIHLRCVSCHSQIVQGKHLVVTVDTCFLCHFKGLQHGRYENALGGCKACHEAPKDEIRLSTGMFKHSDYAGKGVACINCHSDSLKGNGEAPKQVCWNCHNQPTQIARYGDTAYIHEAHITQHKVECSVCHINIEHNLTAGANISGANVASVGGTCGACHEKMHAGPAELFKGTGGRGVPDMPSPMYIAQVDCIACHKAKEHGSLSAAVTGQTFVAVQDSCNYCHGNKYEGKLETWKRTIAAKLQAAEAQVLAANKVLAAAKLPPVELLKCQRLMDDAEHNVRLVKLGHGVHNVDYSTAVLNVAIQYSKKVIKITSAANAVAGRGT